MYVNSYFNEEADGLTKSLQGSKFMQKKKEPPRKNICVKYLLNPIDEARKITDGLIAKVLNKRAYLHNPLAATVEFEINGTQCPSKGIYDPATNCRQRIWAITGYMCPKYKSQQKMTNNYSGMDTIVSKGYRIVI